MNGTSKSSRLAIAKDQVRGFKFNFLKCEAVAKSTSSLDSSKIKVVLIFCLDTTTSVDHLNELFH